MDDERFQIPVMSGWNTMKKQTDNPFLKSQIGVGKSTSWCPLGHELDAGSLAKANVHR